MSTSQRLTSFFALFTLFLLLSACGTLGPETALNANRNGTPKGPHDYQLLIVGTENEKTADMEGSNRHTIFVPLYGKAKIELTEGEFQVLDGNAFDDPAEFQLPAPGLDAYVVGDPGDADVESDYSIFIRPLGKPGGYATITTCAELLDSNFGELLSGKDVKILNGMDGAAYCSIEQVGNLLDGDMRLFRDTGKSVFSNVTAELLTVVFEVEIDEDGDGIVDYTVLVRVPIFDDLLEGEYWEYENNGLRLAQVRFYDCSTNVETGESSCEY
jgi:hypothetical protein